MEEFNDFLFRCFIPIACFMLIGAIILGVK